MGTHEVPVARLAAHRRKASGMGKRSGNGCKCARITAVLREEPPLLTFAGARKAREKHAKCY